jgi:hypothetical protein
VQPHPVHQCVGHDAQVGAAEYGGEVGISGALSPAGVGVPWPLGMGGRSASNLASNNGRVL